MSIISIGNVVGLDGRKILVSMSEHDKYTTIIQSTDINNYSNLAIELNDLILDSAGNVFIVNDLVYQDSTIEYIVEWLYSLKFTKIE